MLLVFKGFHWPDSKLIRKKGAHAHMAGISIFSGRVMRKAFPALILALLIFISLMFLIRYTEAFYLVIILWIVAPVLLVQAYRKLKSILSSEEREP